MLLRFLFLSRSFSNAQLEEVYKIPIFEGEARRRGVEYF